MSLTRPEVNVLMPHSTKWKEAQWCQRCKRQFKDHIKRKCLFDAATFLPSSQTFGVVMNPEYQRWYQETQGTVSHATTLGYKLNQDMTAATVTAFYSPPRRAIEYECFWCGDRAYDPVPDAGRTINMPSRVVKCSSCGGENEIV